jgi:hypothetical protein
MGRVIMRDQGEAERSMSQGSSALMKSLMDRNY